jgi:hypothetical protein
MTKDKFMEVFLAAVETAAKNVEKQYSVQLPRKFEFEFYGFGHNGTTLDVDEVMNKIYLGDDLFIFLIDLGVKKATKTTTTVFVGVSGHKPQARFEDTWNTPPGSGPFKQIISLQFQVVED